MSTHFVNASALSCKRPVVFRHLSKDFLHCILQRTSLNSLPVELRELVISYWHFVELTNESIRKSSRLWSSSNRNKAILIYGHISLWDTSRVTSMKLLFHDLTTFNDNIESWDVSNVTDMVGMFYCFNESQFNQPLNRWNVHNVVNMRNMFAGARSFNQTLNDWDVSNVSNMCEMFKDAHSFNQPLNNWNTCNVRDMGCMFSATHSFNQPLSNWNVRNLQHCQCMFMKNI